jgi:phosphoglycerate dehydrogenase-like enzyme
MVDSSAVVAPQAPPRLGKGGAVPSLARHTSPGLDVLDPEPPPPAHPPLHPRQRGPQPHNAGLSKEAAIPMAISTARNALAGLNGKLDALIVVNREVL